MIQNSEALQDLVRQELAATRPDADPRSVDFLAAGEYTLNYRVSIGGRDAVLRIVTGSQMGLEPPEQALYEAHALEVLTPTSRVPECIGVNPQPEVLDYPYLLLGFLPGHPLDYAADLAPAARCVAEIHRLEPPARHRLQIHDNPVRSILDETFELTGELAEAGGRWDGVRGLAARIEAMPKDDFAAVRADQATINTDLNSHNFIVDRDRVWLIDWEKARIGPTLLDIAHFLLPTTTLWRDATATRLTGEQRERFLRAYLEVRPELDAGEYRAALQVAMRLAAVRALAWCAWALATSERGERAIQNEETLAKCRLFTSPDFLDSLNDELGW